MSPTVCKFTTATPDFAAEASRGPAPPNHRLTMAPNPITLTRGSSFVCRFLGYSRNTVSNHRIPKNPIRISTVRSFSTFYSCGFTSNPTVMPVFKDLGRSEIGFGKMGSEYFRISAASDGGSGGTGGFGGFGDGNSGGKRDGSGSGGDWSLLSWYVFQLFLFP